MPDVAEIVVRCHEARRLAAGFVGWDVELRGTVMLLRRVDATALELHEALAEIADLGLELESFRRLELA